MHRCVNPKVIKHYDKLTWSESSKNIFRKKNIFWCTKNKPSKKLCSEYYIPYLRVYGYRKVKILIWWSLFNVCRKHYCEYKMYLRKCLYNVVVVWEVDFSSWYFTDVQKYNIALKIMTFLHERFSGMPINK